MDRMVARRAQSCDVDGIVAEMSSRQHLRPHQSVREAMLDIAERSGLTLEATTRALSWLQMDPDASIGRLTRVQVLQLARCTFRFWRHELAGRKELADRPGGVGVS